MSPMVREYYPVPRGDREAHLLPSAPELPALVEANRRLASSWTFELAGRPIAQFRSAARAEIMVLARQYSERWGFAVEREWSEPQPLILTGHQPPPFHPGVWIKNFLAGRLAGAVGGAALNLIVDNDEAKGQVLRYPVRTSNGRAEGVRVEEAAFAPPAGGIAFEEQPSEVFEAEIVPHVRHAAPSSLVDAAGRFVFELIPRMEDGVSLAEVISAARHGLEEKVGLRNFELPVSQMADTLAFRLFAAEMVRRHEDLWAAYNDSLAEYRRVYRERSLAQPEPDLARDGPRREVPFWAWRAGQVRRHLWVERRTDGELALYANNEPVGVMSAADAATAESVAARLADLRKDGWKIRPRALTLTLFTRLAVGEVFIHGLGGALYEKITDGIFERMFGVQPPEIVLASCTVRLPLATFPAAERDLDAARRAVRDWHHNPDRLLPPAAQDRAEVRALVEEKRRLVGGMAELARPDRRPAYQRIHQINSLLAAADTDGSRAATERLAEVERQLRANAILRGREYPFIFYDAGELARYYSTVM
jgi:hypothetical protein